MYGKKYLKTLLKQLDQKNISDETLFMLSKISVNKISDEDKSLANTDLNTIFLPSMKKIMKLIESSSSKDIKDMELLIVRQQEILESIVDHEVAHSLEYVYKKIGMTIYNIELLPKLIDGSLGVTDEKSFEDKKDILREFMINKFIEFYNPNSQDILEFKTFVEEYYIPDGPFGLINQISNLDNYIVDIYIENDIINLVPNKEKMDSKFIEMRKLLYNDLENFSIYKCMQIFIDPRFNNNLKYLNVIETHDKFNSLMGLDITNLNISKDLFSKTNPEMSGLTVSDIILEIKEIVKELREYNHINKDYIGFKNDNNINSNNISLLTSKLAKIVYIKELEFKGDKTKEIEDILLNDDMFNSNYEESNSESTETKDSLLKEFLEGSFNNKLEKLGHNEDFANELSDFMIESLEDISTYLSGKIIINKFENVENSDLDNISNILSKSVSTDYVKYDKDVKQKRETLLEEIKNNDKFYKLKELIDEFKDKLGEYTFQNNFAGDSLTMAEDYIQGNEFMYTLNGDASINICLHAFIDDSISMKQKYDDKYSIMDYQIANVMLLTELFKDVQGVKLLITNFPKKDNSINILYDSKENKDLEISSIIASKMASPLYQYIIESNITINSLNSKMDIINIFMSDGDDTMDPKKIKISEDFFKEIVKDSYFLQLSGEEVFNIRKNFENRYSIINKNPIDNMIELIEDIVSKLDKNIEFSDKPSKNLEI